MNASYQWLRAFVDADLSPEQMRDLITSRVTTVDELVPLRGDLAPIVVARVVECSRHPDSDRLSLTKVDAGSGGLLDVVCGAPNVRAGALYPFAPVGAVMPGGMKIERRKIRGAVSEGMLCSARELGLGDDQEGILELQVTANPGTPLLQAMSVGDTRLVIDVSPVRPDLLSHLGLAREVAAALAKPSDKLELAGMRDFLTGTGAVTAFAASRRTEGDSGGTKVILEDAEGAPHYCGVVIRGLTVGPSPQWLVDRLVACGSRSINNVVDATNYLMHCVGQPMHAFDLGKLAGGRVVVRRAKAGERLVTLDGVERALTPDMTVIADGERAQAVAGVMGGRDSEVADATRDIFLEVACFDPTRTRATRRALNLPTDASFRFERGVDPERPPYWVKFAMALITKIAGGSASVPVSLYPRPIERRPITLRVARVARVLGEPVAAAEIKRLLRSIGFAVEARPGTEMLHADQEMVASAPSWRRDVAEEIDLIEEVARLRGYDTFSTELRPFRPSAVPDSATELIARHIRERLVSAGLMEVRPIPFVAGGPGHVRVTNPVAENEAHLRRRIIETLTGRAEYNLARMQGDVRIFEIGSVFTPSRASLPYEETRVGALVMGHRRPPHFTEPRPPAYDEWDAKGLAELLAEAAFPDARLSLAPASGGPDELGQVLWEVRADDRQVGVVRRLRLDAPVWASPAFGIELKLGPVANATVAPPRQSAYQPTPAVPTGPHRRTIAYTPLPSLPPSEVDLALLLANDLPADRVENVIRRAAGELLERLTLFDEFRGAGVPDGMRSVAWRLTFRHPERTLRDKEVAGRREKILGALEEELGVRPRTA